MTAAYMPLPKGPESQLPTRIVVHCMGEYIDTEAVDYHAVAWLRKLGISAHAFVTPSGVVIRSRDDDQGAWHAKAKGYNRDSLGVEFLVPGLHNIVTLNRTIKHSYLSDAQYAAGVALVLQWCSDWPIDEVVRHSTIDPQNKEDPGIGFPWVQFLVDTGRDNG